MSEVTEDWLLNEQVRIFQPKKGYRAGLDAILLAASLPDRDGSKMLDMGCGAGGVLFPAAFRLKTSRFVGLERDTGILPLTRRGVDENGFSDRIEIVEGDASALSEDWENQFDVVFSNPPYFEPERIQTVHEGRENAYLAEVPLKNWLKSMLFAAKPKGRITIVHRAAVLGDILEYLMSRAGQIEILPVRPAPGEPAKRVLVTARKGLRRGEVVLHDGFAMHVVKGDPAYTARAAAILGGASLIW